MFAFYNFLLQFIKLGLQMEHAQHILFTRISLVLLWGNSHKILYHKCTCTVGRKKFLKKKLSKARNLEISVESLEIRLQCECRLFGLLSIVVDIYLFWIYSKNFSDLRINNQQIVAQYKSADFVYINVELFWVGYLCDVIAMTLEKRSSSK